MSGWAGSAVRWHCFKGIGDGRGYGYDRFLKAVHSASLLLVIAAFGNAIPLARRDEAF